MPPPDVSVVIPASRPTRLAFALEALASQTIDHSRFEVVVVRDGAAGIPVTPPNGLSVRVLVGSGDGNLATLRNQGWRAARGRLIAFTDDDCRPAPAWLETLLATADGTDVLLQGRTEPDPDERQLLHGLARSQEISKQTGWFETCNMAYPRELLERLDGFDERFAAIGEDTDLAWRAIESGARSRFLGDAIVWHAVLSRTIPGAFREVVRRRDAPAVVGRHPQLLDSLTSRHFWHAGHRAIAIVALGLLLTRRRPALRLTALLPYLGYRMNWRQPSPRRLARVVVTAPLFAALDLFEIAMRAPSAIRHRVPLI